MEIWGLQRKAGTLRLHVALKVMQGSRVLLHKPHFFDRPISIPDVAPPMASVTGEFTPRRPGLYTMTLHITDRLTGKSLVHSQAFQVTGGSPPTAPSGAAPSGDGAPRPGRPRAGQ